MFQFSRCRRTNALTLLGMVWHILNWRAHVFKLSSACAAIWFLIRRNSFQSWYLWEKSFPIDLVRHVENEVVRDIESNFIVIHKRFKWHIMCFELNTVEKYYFCSVGIFFKRESEKKMKRWEDMHVSACVYWIQPLHNINMTKGGS